ncbi:MAG: Uma2 family endonuclease [Chloroflexota bacterium]
MVVVHQQNPMHMSEAEYLAFEQDSDTRHEFLNGKVYAMAGASRAHSRLMVNLTRLIGNHLQDSPCELYPADMRIMMTQGKYTYPDLSVVCGDAQFAENTFDSLVNPVMIIEILSPSTEAYDRGAKFRNYRLLPSLREYVLVAQDAPRIERFTLSDDAIWHYVDIGGLDTQIELTKITCTLALSDVYQNVQFKNDEK